MKQFWKKLLAVMTAAAAIILLMPMDVKASGVPELTPDGTVETKETFVQYYDEKKQILTDRYDFTFGVYCFATHISAKTLTVTVKAIGSASDSSATLDIEAYIYKEKRVDLYSTTGIKSGETKQFTLNDAYTFEGGVYLDMISDVDDFKFEISAVEDSSSETAEQSKPAVGTLYRLYNPNSSEHFYTGSTAERDSLKTAGWKDEGTAWTSPAEGSPVYRLYNPNAGEHFFTKKASEKENLVAVGWKYEGIGWNSDDNKKVPVYREYNPNAKTGSHNYTTSKAEHDHLVSLGWKDEGIAWYGA